MKVAIYLLGSYWTRWIDKSPDSQSRKHDDARQGVFLRQDVIGVTWPQARAWCAADVWGHPCLSEV